MALETVELRFVVGRSGGMSYPLGVRSGVCSGSFNGMRTDQEVGVWPP